MDFAPVNSTRLQKYVQDPSLSTHKYNGILYSLLYLQHERNAGRKPRLHGQSLQKGQQKLSFAPTRSCC